MIEWEQAECEMIASPAVLEPLLLQAIAARPDQSALRVKYADLKLDLFEFDAAIQSLETAVSLSAADPLVRVRLARCYNAVGRHSAAIAVLKFDPEPRFERADAHLGRGEEKDAEAELRSILIAHPSHHHAAWKLLKLLRLAGRLEELLSLCQELYGKGVTHSQLLYDWGRALALAGDTKKAEALLFRADRVWELTLPTPAGSADIDAFNTALADDLLSNQTILSNFPLDEANRGSSRVHDLYGGKNPALVRQLLRLVQDLVDAHVATLERLGPFDPWLDSRPKAAHLRAWGLIQKGSAYEDWHLHRGGWLSGVYYVRVPGLVSAEGEGLGCIEFGAPRKLAEERPQFAEVLRRRPVEGNLLLSPSHYSHRTIPTGANDHRISLAFDVVRS